MAPENAWAWLRAAREAHNRKDYSGLLTALNKVSSASNWIPPNRLAQATALQYLPEHIDGLPRANILIQTQYAFLSQQASGLELLVDFCSQARDSNVTQTCSKLAKNVLDNADSLLALRAGIAIAEKVAFDPVTVKKLRDEAAALADAQSRRLDWSKTASITDNCTGLDQAVGDLESNAKFGELKTLRNIAARQPN